MERHLPQLSELAPPRSSAPSIRTGAPRGSRRPRTWRRCGGSRGVVRPCPAFDYVDGAAGQDTTHRRNRRRSSPAEPLPRILHGTDTETEHGDRRCPQRPAVRHRPPTGFTRFMHSEGEIGEPRRPSVPASRSPCPPRQPLHRGGPDAAPDAQRRFQLTPA
ncbi:hypothetical protein QJS66_03080 [Kocuria rhizophila]|nr:hypothetical protein QJS66_03080 [Kocuria rhizophila]